MPGLEELLRQAEGPVRRVKSSLPRSGGEGDHTKCGGGVDGGSLRRLALDPASHAPATPPPGFTWSPSPCSAWGGKGGASPTRSGYAPAMRFLLALLTLALASGGAPPAPAAEVAAIVTADD